jgi:hypothetical protein
LQSSEERQDIINNSNTLYMHTGNGQLSKWMVGGRRLSFSLLEWQFTNSKEGRQKDEYANG